MLCCYLLKACLFSSERQKGSGPGGEQKLGDTGKCGEKGNCSKDILYEKTIDFNDRNENKILKNV